MANQKPNIVLIRGGKEFRRLSGTPKAHLYTKISILDHDHRWVKHIDFVIDQIIITMDHQAPYDPYVGNTSQPAGTTKAAAIQSQIDGVWPLMLPYRSCLIELTFYLSSLAI